MTDVMTSGEDLVVVGHSTRLKNPDGEPQASFDATTLVKSVEIQSDGGFTVTMTPAAGAHKQLLALKVGAATDTFALDFVVAPRAVFPPATGNGPAVPKESDFSGRALHTADLKSVVGNSIGHLMDARRAGVDALIPEAIQESPIDPLWYERLAVGVLETALNFLTLGIADNFATGLMNGPAKSMARESTNYAVKRTRSMQANHKLAGLQAANSTAVGSKLTIAGAFILAQRAALADTELGLRDALDTDVLNDAALLDREEPGSGYLSLVALTDGYLKASATAANEQSSSSFQAYLAISAQSQLGVHAAPTKDNPDALATNMADPSGQSRGVLPGAYGDNEAIRGVLRLNLVESGDGYYAIDEAIITGLGNNQFADRISKYRLGDLKSPVKAYFGYYDTGTFGAEKFVIGRNEADEYYHSFSKAFLSARDLNESQGDGYARNVFAHLADTHVKPRRV